MKGKNYITLTTPREIVIHKDFLRDRSDVLKGGHDLGERRVQIQRGCSYGCLYCPSRPSNCSLEAWRRPEKRLYAMTKKYPQSLLGVTVFPATHNITPDNIEGICRVLHRLCSAGHNVLIPAKLSSDMANALLTFLHGRWTYQLCFRIAVTGTDESLQRFYEGRAPSYEERIAVIGYIKPSYATMLAIDPLLSPHVEDVLDRLTRRIKYIPVSIGLLWGKYQSLYTGEQNGYGMNALENMRRRVQKYVSTAASTGRRMYLFRASCVQGGV